MFYTYIIKSQCGRFYIGSTKNLLKRISQHNNGESKWTSRFKNWKIVYKEEFETRSKAVQREMFLKKLKGGDAFKKIINNAE